MGGDTDTLKRLEDGNAHFRKGPDPSLMARLAQKQEPFVAVLNCSDSRVVPQKNFHLSLGDAFVVRVIGNCASDPSVLGSLEYAVEQLHVRMILVLGHTGCGAIRAAVEGKGHDSLSKIFRDIERARDKVGEGRSNDFDAIAESNVRLQIRLMMANSMTITDALSWGMLLRAHERPADYGRALHESFRALALPRASTLILIDGLPAERSNRGLGLREFARLTFGRDDVSCALASSHADPRFRTDPGVTYRALIRLDYDGARFRQGS